MSKKNKKKYKFSSPIDASAPSAAPATAAAAAKVPENLSYDMQKEFRNLGLIIGFILALLCGLYLYDQQTHVLQALTGKLFGF